MVITVYTDNTFSFITKTPPVPVLIKKELNLQTASGRPNRDKVGKLTQEPVSYTHLDVYKRQPFRSGRRRSLPRP